MKSIARQFFIAIAFIICSVIGPDADTIGTFTPADIAGRAEGVGSLPSVILRDGTVCATSVVDPRQCTALGAVSTSVAKIVSDGGGEFDGVFDLLGDGVPQVFVDYWPLWNDPNCLPPYNTPGDGPCCCDAMALLVYRYSGHSYQRFLTLNAPTEGYGAGGAWFLDESPRKAIFETRCGGSSGDCLVYLDLIEHTLEPISDDYFLEGDPIFEEIDHDGNDEIFIPARGRDRTAAQGAALLKWTGNGYRVWWPDWKSPPYVIYAQLTRVGTDPLKEIVAVLDSGKNAGQGSNSRELGIWKLRSGKWQRVATAPLYPVADIGWTVVLPTLDKITSQPYGAEIFLSNSDGSTLTCRYADRKLTCPAAASLPPK